MKEQIMISKARKKQAVEQEAGKKESEKEEVQEDEVNEKESEVKETGVKKTEVKETEVKEVEETEERKETKDEAAEEEKMAVEKEVAEKEAAEKEVAEKQGESVAAAAVPDLCEDMVALLVEAKAAMLARISKSRKKRAVETEAGKKEAEKEEVEEEEVEEKESDVKETEVKETEVKETEVKETEVKETEAKDTEVEETKDEAAMEEKMAARKEAAEKEAVDKEVAKKKGESVAAEAVRGMCEVVVALLVEAEDAMLATLGARRAIVALHQDMDSLTSLPTLPRHELAKVDLPNEMELHNEVGLSDEVQLPNKVEELKLDDSDKHAFGKTSSLTSKLASEQEILQSIVHRYTATSRSAGKSCDVTPDLEVVYEFGHGKDIICEVQKIANKLAEVQEIADKQVLEMHADKKVFAVSPVIAQYLRLSVESSLVAPLPVTEDALTSLCCRTALTRRRWPRRPPGLVHLVLPPCLPPAPCRPPAAGGPPPAGPPCAPFPPRT